jgi:hypothetical protein
LFLQRKSGHLPERRAAGPAADALQLIHAVAVNANSAGDPAAVAAALRGIVHAG